MTQRTKGVLYTRADLFIHNALDDPVVVERLAERGITEADLSAASEMLADALAKESDVEERRGRQVLSTKELEALRAAAHARYMSHVEAARITFSDDDALRLALGLDRPRKTKRLGDWMMQAYSFDDTFFTTEASEALSSFGVTEDEMREGRSMIDAVLAANREQETLKAIARAAVRTAQDAREAVESWLTRSVRVARYAFADDPEYLERLGVTA